MAGEENTYSVISASGEEKIVKKLEEMIHQKLLSGATDGCGQEGRT